MAANEDTTRGTPTLELFFSPEESESESELRRRVAQRLAVREELVLEVRVVRRSLDARRGRPLGFRLHVEAALGGTEAPPRPEPPPHGPTPPHEPTPASPSRSQETVGRRASRAEAGPPVVIVGSGPAGTFAALRLAVLGRPAVVLEQGKRVQPRRHDLAALVRRGELDPLSNYCFGEGGAGTYSDGKLYTRTKDREAVRFVLETLVSHGASSDILVESRPHVGSNLLPKILTELRERLEDRGVVYRFERCVEELVCDRAQRVVAVRLASGEELACAALVLATGHSARPLYERLVAGRVACVAKPFAVGARVEHPQPLIDELQYGQRYCRPERHPRLPAAFYELTAQVEGRGVYSFCMCPGGWIVNASTEPEGLCTNGMSLSRRDSPWADAALVVTVGPEGWDSSEVRSWIAASAASDGAAAEVPPVGHPLGGLALQRAIERRAFRLGGGGFVAPAQRLEDFVAGRASAVVSTGSYRPGVVGSNLAEALPPGVVAALQRGVRAFDATMRGFLTREAQLVGVETRTSSPLRILRDPITFESPSHPGLYPVGEGAGYAGGIVSAAVDGWRVAERVGLSLD